MNFVYLKCNVFISLPLFWDRHWHFRTKSLHCRYLCAIILLLQNDLINKIQSFWWFFIFFWRFILVFSFQDFGDFGLFVYCSSFAGLVASLNSFPTDTNNVSCKDWVLEYLVCTSWKKCNMFLVCDSQKDYYPQYYFSKFVSSPRNIEWLWNTPFYSINLKY